MSVEEFDREEWIEDFVFHGELTERQAEVYVRLVQGESLGQVAAALRTDRYTVHVVMKNVQTVSRRDRVTYLLMFGPVDFHQNPEDYPEELNERVDWALNPPDGVDTMHVPSRAERPRVD